MPLVPELREDHEDVVGLLAGQLDVLVGLRAAAGQALAAVSLSLLTHLDDGAAAAGHGLGLTGDDLRQGCLAQLAPLALEGVGELVGRLGSARGRRLRRGVDGRRCSGRRDAEGCTSAGREHEAHDSRGDLAH
ncbi:hypothetical protein ASD06_15550 [Angustibacter sp. Root456]|nr:hypothetical protein ASD06_15550 [Angustibacter sp. Root456]